MDKWPDVRGLALSIGVKPEAFKKWRQRGIPPRWVFPLLAKAREGGVDVSEADLLELSSLSTTSESQAA